MTRPRPIFVAENRSGGARGMSVMADAASTGGQLEVSEGIFVETNPEQLDAILQTSGVKTVGPPLTLSD